MRYFKDVPFWKLALLNFIVGSTMSVGFVISWYILNPLICLDYSCSKVTAIEYIVVILIYVVIIFTGYFSNAIMWKKYRKDHLVSSDKKVSMKSILKLTGSLLVFVLGLFMVYFFILILNLIFVLLIMGKG